jgi:hypothetical protein
VLAHVGDDIADLGKRLRHVLAGIHVHPLEKKLPAYVAFPATAALMKSDAARARLREVMPVLGGFRGY